MGELDDEHHSADCNDEVARVAQKKPYNYLILLIIFNITKGEIKK
jgi:hypothetical protein